MATRRNKRRQRRGGNPLRHRLENCIKELVVALACTNRYHNWNNFPEQLQSRLAITFRQTQNIDEAITRCTTDMLNAQHMQVLVAYDDPVIVANNIVEWFGLHAFHCLSYAERTRLTNKLYQCIYPNRPLANVLHLANNAANPQANALNNAFTADVVEDLASYMPAPERY